MKKKTENQIDPNNPKLQAGETTESYRQRLCKSKDILNLSWQQIADLLNDVFNTNYDEATYRRAWKNGNRAPRKVDDDYELRKEAMKLSDINVQERANIRAIAREETIKEIAHDVVLMMNKDKPLLPTAKIKPYEIDTDKSAILCLSDWHYGIECETPNNIYNPDICKHRLTVLLNKVFAFLSMDKPKELHVVNLGDLISGYIHLQMRLQNRIDIITQVIEVQEILCEFLSNLANVVPVYYYDCYDNHSRLDPNKKTSLELESLTRIIHYFVKERTFNSKYPVIVCENLVASDLISFDVLDFTIAGVHGHKDRPVNIIEHLRLNNDTVYDLVLTAHNHHFWTDERYSTVVVGNGSLMGTDTYAYDLRAHSTPSQNYILISRDNPVEAIRRIDVR